MSRLGRSFGGIKLYIMSIYRLVLLVKMKTIFTI